MSGHRTPTEETTEKTSEKPSPIPNIRESGAGLDSLHGEFGFPSRAAAGAVRPTGGGRASARPPFSFAARLSRRRNQGPSIDNDTVHRSVPTHIPFQIAAARTVPTVRSATHKSHGARTGRKTGAGGNIRADCIIGKGRRASPRTGTAMNTRF